MTARITTTTTTGGIGKMVIGKTFVVAAAVTQIGIGTIVVGTTLKVN